MQNYADLSIEQRKIINLIENWAFSAYCRIQYFTAISFIRFTGDLKVNL